ncbi:MAG: methyltransferase [Oscillospiraceae bacterium]|nr:methyltransferase [Oscillospiraceae bacterium]
MEFLPGGYTLEIPEGVFPLSTDSMALAEFVRLPRNARVLDLGSGCGTLGLLLCAGDDTCHVTGVELDPAAHAAAVENISRNHLEPRMESICADLRTVSREFSPGSFSCIVSNPPYFSGGALSHTLQDARQEQTCALEDLIRSGSRVLKYGGDFFLVHKPERLAEIIATASRNGLEAKRLRLLRHREGGPVTLILLQLRKGGKPGLILEENTLFDGSGGQTAYYRRVYHL